MKSSTDYTHTPWAVSWLTWPILFSANVVLALRAISQHWNYSNVLTSLLLGDIVVLVTLESLFPLQRKWKMSWRSFVRDVKYIVAGSLTVATSDVILGLLSIRLNSGHVGLITDWPLYVSVPTALIVVDLLNYWQHRWSHELDGNVGKFLWRTHAAHHLPDRLYVLMHPAMHPINGFVVRGLATVVPLYFLGATPETVLLSSTIVTFQGLISHFNVDIRTGWFNYVFVGTELHRFHHSAELSESKNYAVTLSLLDILFGSFYYRPGTLPERIGVVDPNEYPDSKEFWKVMKLPFHPEIEPRLSDAAPAQASK